MRHDMINEPLHTLYVGEKGRTYKKEINGCFRWMLHSLQSPLLAIFVSKRSWQFQIGFSVITSFQQIRVALIQRYAIISISASNPFPMRCQQIERQGSQPSHFHIFPGILLFDIMEKHDDLHLGKPLLDKGTNPSQCRLLNKEIPVCIGSQFLLHLGKHFVGHPQIQLCHRPSIQRHICHRRETLQKSLVSPVDDICPAFYLLNLTSYIKQPIYHISLSNNLPMGKRPIWSTNYPYSLSYIHLLWFYP